MSEAVVKVLDRMLRVTVKWARTNWMTDANGASGHPNQLLIKLEITLIKNVNGPLSMIPFQYSRVECPL